MEKGCQFAQVMSITQLPFPHQPALEESGLYHSHSIVLPESCLHCCVLSDSVTLKRAFLVSSRLDRKLGTGSSDRRVVAKAARLLPWPNPSEPQQFIFNEEWHHVGELYLFFLAISPGTILE